VRVRAYGVRGICVPPPYRATESNDVSASPLLLVTQRRESSTAAQRGEGTGGARRRVFTEIREETLIPISDLVQGYTDTGDLCSK